MNTKGAETRTLGLYDDVTNATAAIKPRADEHAASVERRGNDCLQPVTTTDKLTVCSSFVIEEFPLTSILEIRWLDTYELQPSTEQRQLSFLTCDKWADHSFTVIVY